MKDGRGSGVIFDKKNRKKGEYILHISYKNLRIFNSYGQSDYYSAVNMHWSAETLSKQKKSVVYFRY